MKAKTRLAAFFLFTLLALSGRLAAARVFQIGNESFASYLRAQYGPAGQGDSPFAPAAGTATTFDSAYVGNMAYEFGFIYSTSLLNWRFGFEVIKPADLKNVQGTAADGTPWYTVSNLISGYVPKIGLELNLKKWAASRLFISGDYGSATVTVQNSYTFTPAGSTQFGGLADFREEVKGTAPLIESSIGFESLLSDTATWVLEAGYRSLEVASFSHNADATTFQGVVAKGDPAKNTDGTDRTLSLSGGFAALSIRIWIK